MSNNHKITEEDVRNYVLDRTIEDNELEMDLTFSSEEIADAMRRCARSYNSITPMVSFVDADCLSSDTNVFLDGVVAQLYISRMSKLMRNDVDYTAGNVGVNIVEKQIKHLGEMAKYHKAEFITAAKAIKCTINTMNAWGQLG
jgi:hypothetical protein